MRHLILPLTLLLVAGLTPAVNAQIRTVTVNGSPSGPGTLHITIEDFDKPQDRDGRLLAAAPQSVHVIDVPVAAGWDCSQTTQTIFKALVAALVPPYTVVIAPTNPCQIYIERPAGGNAWSIVVINSVPGLSVTVDEGAIPVVPTTWGGLKARYASP